MFTDIYTILNPDKWRKIYKSYRSLRVIYEGRARTLTYSFFFYYMHKLMVTYIGPSRLQVELNSFNPSSHAREEFGSGTPKRVVNEKKATCEPFIDSAHVQVCDSVIK
jgi:hypothetical protein